MKQILCLGFFFLLLFFFSFCFVLFFVYFLEQLVYQFYWNSAYIMKLQWLNYSTSNKGYPSIRPKQKQKIGPHFVKSLGIGANVYRTQSILCRCSKKSNYLYSRVSQRIYRSNYFRLFVSIGVCSCPSLSILFYLYLSIYISDFIYIYISVKKSRLKIS